MRRQKARVRIVWHVEESGGGHATVTDESPAMGHLDPEDVSDVVADVSAGLGIEVVAVTSVSTQGEELAAWAVQHGQTGVFGRMTVLPA